MFEIRTDGISYRNGIPVDSAVIVLDNFGKIYSFALAEACTDNNITYPDRPSLKLKSVRNGSGEFTLAIGSIPLIVPYLPEIYQSAWVYFTKTYSLIEMLNKYRQKNKRNLELNINNSPGALVNIGDGSVYVSNGVFRAAKASIPNFSNIAKHVNDDINAFVKTFHSSRPAEQKTINHENAENFISKEAINDDIESIELVASIYRFNKKTGAGNLEFQDEDEELRQISFIADDVVIPLAASALSAGYCTIIATAQRKTNILNESKITKFYIHRITNIRD